MPMRGMVEDAARRWQGYVERRAHDPGAAFEASRAANVAIVTESWKSCWEMGRWGDGEWRKWAARGCALRCCN
ncbi:hypothetical protein CUJ90_27100 [Paraburkholderia terricola]|nr:hypothetical protein CUJ90_27100 [Paraburkholderia terricola]